jgi:hypothetical protein
MPQAVDAEHLLQKIGPSASLITQELTASFLRNAPMVFGFIPECLWFHTRIERSASLAPLLTPGVLRRHDKCTSHL